MRQQRNIGILPVTLFALVLVSSCELQDNWLLDVPSFNGDSQLTGTTGLSDSCKYALEGIYLVTKGMSTFGDTVVVKQTRDKISIFGYQNVCYFILDNGYKGSQIILEGYWRFAIGNKTGLARFTVTNANDLIRGDTSVTNITISGMFGSGASTPGEPVELHLLEKFTPQLRADPFIIGAHRSGGRTSDRLPASENSVAMIAYTEYFGSTGIEVDIQLTRDKVPVLYHDDDLNRRLIQKGPVYGKIQDYKFAQLRTLVKLIHGEDIPSLEEAFDAVLNRTKLTTVWLDIKDAESLQAVVPIQQKYLKLAAKAGRKLDIWVGIPSDDVFNAFISIGGYQDIPSLCELSADKVAAVNARAWSFRWTQGLMEQDVTTMHSQGRKCLVWTLDVPEFMEIYATHGGNDASKRFDGILTNYPSLLAYYHYVRHNKQN